LDNLATALYTSGLIFIILFAMSAAVAVVIRIIHRVVGGKQPSSR
jgi:hypothetical protein